MGDWNPVFVHVLCSYPDRLLQNKNSLSSILLKPVREGFAMKNNLWHSASFIRQFAILNIWKSVLLKKAMKVLLAKENTFQSKEWYVCVSAGMHIGIRKKETRRYAFLQLPFGPGYVKPV